MRSIILGISMFLAACSSSSVKNKPQQRIVVWPDTATGGGDAASAEIGSHRYSIIRYDLPSFTSGPPSESDLAYRMFGVERMSPLFNSLEYCDAYNKTMDQALKRRYGKAYLIKRKFMLPPPGAKRYKQYRANKSLHPTANRLRVDGVVTISSCSEIVLTVWAVG